MRHVDLAKTLIAGATLCLATLPTPPFAEPVAESQEQLERDLTVAQKPIFQIGQLQRRGADRG
jgi:hypothetical protein